MENHPSDEMLNDTEGRQLVQAIHDRKTKREELYEFRDAYKNVARDRMLEAMASEAVSTRALIDIGRRFGAFPGVTQGMLTTLAKHDVIKSPEHGWWTLAENVAVPEAFRPETVGEVETIAPETTRVGDMISHKGRIYRLAAK